MAGIQLSGLPRIEENTGAAATAAIGALDHLDGIKTSIENMSIRLNIKLGSIATMLSDFFDTKTNTIDPVIDNTLLYGINVKLGSIAMILSDFFDEQRERWIRQDLIGDNDEQIRRPDRDKPEKKPKPKKEWEFDFTNIFGKLLTGLGVAFLVSKINFGEAIRESGIIAYVSRGLSKMLVFGTGLANFFSKINNGPLIGGITKVFGTVIRAFHTLATKLVPFYSSALGLLKWTGKILLPIAVITSVVDFFRGFNQAANLWDGIKLGIAEVITGWVGWPLEFLKDVISWASAKLGFESFSKILDGYDLVSIVREGVKSAFDFVKGIFGFDPANFPTIAATKDAIVNTIGWAINTGVGLVKQAFELGPVGTFWSITDYLTGVLVSAKDLIVNTFSSIDYEAMYETSKTLITDAFWSAINDVQNFFIGLMQKIKEMIPSKEDITNKLKSYLPDFITGEGEYSADNRIKNIETQIAEQQALINKSKSGENVFIGPEEWGQNGALNRIDMMKQMRDEIRREEEKKRAANGGGSGNVTIVRGGDTHTNASSMNINNFSASPSSGRPD